MTISYNFPVIVSLETNLDEKSRSDDYDSPYDG